MASIQAPKISGDRLKELRKSKCYSLTQAARLFNVDRSTYMRWERGENAIPGPAVVLAEIIYWMHHMSPGCPVKHMLMYRAQGE